MIFIHFFFRVYNLHLNLNALSDTQTVSKERLTFNRQIEAFCDIFQLEK
jgi:hypothetical protein